MKRLRTPLRIIASILLLGCMANFMADLSLSLDKAAYQPVDDGRHYLVEGTSPASGTLFFREYSEESESNFKQSFEHVIDKSFLTSTFWNLSVNSEQLSVPESLRLSGFLLKSPDLVILHRSFLI